MSYTVWHASTAARVLIAALMEVTHDTAPCLAAPSRWIQVNYVAERVIRVVCERALVMQYIIVGVDLFKAAKHFDVSATMPGSFRLSQVVAGVDTGHLVGRAS